MPLLQEQRIDEIVVHAATPLESFCAGLEAGQLGIWTWDIPSSRITWSTNLAGWHGRAGGGLEGTFLLKIDDLEPQQQPGVLMAIQECLRTGQPYCLDYHLPPLSGHEERRFEVSATVIIRDDTPAQVMGICRDVTQRLRVNREVHIRARQHEAVAHLGESALTESNLQNFFNEVVTTVADILEVEFAKILELEGGDAEMLLRAGHGWPAGLIGTAHVSTNRESHAGYALAAGRPVILEDIATETRFPVTQLLLDRAIVSGIATPIAGRDGQAYGTFCTHSTKRRQFTDYDVSFVTAVANVVAGAIQRRQLDERHELMIRELRHRSGNLFAQLLALFSQTARTSRNLPDLMTKYEARVLALADSHRLITEGGWKSIALNELLDILLTPYQDQTSRQGPNVLLEPDSTLGLGMVLHELLTNACKHGSLSVPSGRIDLTWSVARTQQGRVLALEWKESGGRSPRKQGRSGFGTRLISMVIERQLSGQVQQTFTPKGSLTRLVLPLARKQ